MFLREFITSVFFYGKISKKIGENNFTFRNMTEHCERNRQTSVEKKSSLNEKFCSLTL